MTGTNPNATPTYPAPVDVGDAKTGTSGVATGGTLKPSQCPTGTKGN